MQKINKAVIIIMLTALCLAIPARAASAININDIIEDEWTYDGKTVTVEGEAIGESMARGEYSWVNINDGSNAIGIWLKTEDAKKISSFGDYKHIGDTIRITGVFSRNCKEHGGDVDIHSASFTIVSNGTVVKEEIPSNKIIAAVLLLCISGMASFLYFRSLKKNKK